MNIDDLFLQPSPPVAELLASFRELGSARDGLSAAVEAREAAIGILTHEDTARIAARAVTMPDVCPHPIPETAVTYTQTVNAQWQVTATTTDGTQISIVIEPVDTGTIEAAVRVGIDGPTQLPGYLTGPENIVDLGGAVVLFPFRAVKTDTPDENPGINPTRVAEHLGFWWHRLR